MKPGVAAMLLCGMLAATGAGGEIERLGQPCHAKNVLAGRVVTDRATGRELLALTNMNETGGAELIFVDFEKDTGRVFHAPAGAGSWALREVPGDRLVVGTFYDGQFMVFDLKRMAFVKNVGFPGESYIWNLAPGGDGRVYGGTYPGGKLGALDLDTYAVEDCGAPAPPNLYLRTVSALPDGRILCSFIAEKPTTQVYDPAMKRFWMVPPSLEGVTAGAAWNGFFVAGSQAFRGRALEPVEPLPFPAPPAKKGAWSVDTDLTTADTLYLRQGNAVYRFRKGDRALSLVADLDLRGGRLLAASRTGAVLGVRGQDYFVLRPGARDMTLRPIPAESGPRPTLFLRADPKGVLWGGPHFGQTLFSLDPRTKQVVNTGAVCDAGGEVYDVAFLNGVLYAASYAGGDIVAYDPAKPWSQWDRKNPRVVASVGARGYIRPTGGIAAGPDGMLYSGWMAKYGAYGGAVAVTDPATGETALWENPLGAQAVAGLAVDAGGVYIGTSLGANGLSDKKGEPVRFGMLDRATGRALFTREFTGASSVRACAVDAKTGRVVMAVDGRPRLFDPAVRRFLDDLAADAPPVGSVAIVAPGDGRALYGSGKDVVSLDVTTGRTERLAELPADVSCVAVGPGGEVYAACGPDVYRVR